MAALVALLAPLAWTLDTSKLKPAGYVNDFAHVLSPGNAQVLEAYSARLEQATGVQLAIVLVDSLEGDPVEDVANRLYREWGIGKKGKDEGALILLAIKDHKNRIEIGYGLEPIINDGAAGGILRGIRPILQQGNYAGALLAAAQQMGNQIAQAKGVALDGEVFQPRSARPRAPSIPFPLGFWAELFCCYGSPAGAGAAAPGCWRECCLVTRWDAAEAGAEVDLVATTVEAEGEAEDSAASAAGIRAAAELPAAGKKMTDTLEQLVTKLERAYSDRLVSVVLYGSGASDEHNHKFSDLNVLCVLKEVTPRELGEGEPILRWWREHVHPSPLLMSGRKKPTTRPTASPSSSTT